MTHRLWLNVLLGVHDNPDSHHLRLAIRDTRMIGARIGSHEHASTPSDLL